jgi:protein amnionless
MNNLLIEILILSYISGSLEVYTKKWSPSSSLNDPSNWQDQKLPCKSDSILFQSKNQDEDVIRLTDFSASKIILGENMAFLLERNMKLIFPEKDNSCPNKEVKKFKEMKDYYWISSINWVDETILSNKAVPDVERLPCDNDYIIFSPNVSYEVDLQSTPYISFFRIALDNIEYTVDQFYEFLQTKIGQIVFKNTENTLFMESQCTTENCPCHQESDALLEQLCENENNFCKTPLCETSIRPIGHCCPICGAILHVNISNVNDGFNIREFQNQTARGMLTVIF